MEKHTNQEKIELIAYHEAGHVFAYWALDIPFKYVTIIKDKVNLGHVKEDKRYSKPFLEAWRLGKLKKESLTKQLKILDAGPISAKYHSKKNHNGFEDKDEKDIFRLALHYFDKKEKLGIDEKEKFEPFLKQIRSETTDMIKQNWVLVELIAKKLLEKKK